MSSLENILFDQRENTQRTVNMLPQRYVHLQRLTIKVVRSKQSMHADYCSSLVHKRRSGACSIQLRRHGNLQT